MIPNPYTQTVQNIAQTVDEIIEMMEKNSEKLAGSKSGFEQFGHNVIEIRLKIKTVYQFAYLYSLSVVEPEEWRCHFLPSGAIYVVYTSSRSEIRFWIGEMDSDFAMLCKGYLDDKNNPNTEDYRLYDEVVLVTGELPF